MSPDTEYRPDIAVGVIARGEKVQTWGAYDGQYEFTLVMPTGASEDEVMGSILDRREDLIARSQKV